MRFYYVALSINTEQPVQTEGGKRLAYYIRKHQAIKQRDLLNSQWVRYNRAKGKQDKIYKVYCVESEPKEIE